VRTLGSRSGGAYTKVATKTATRPAIFDSVTEFEDRSELSWDDVVDVICAGPGPGVLAQAILCADLGLTVELADAVAPAHLDDPDTMAYLEAMTNDLGQVGGLPADLALPLLHAEPVAPRTDRRAKVEPFIGSRLCDWSVRCLASPFGVVYSAVPEAGVIAMRSNSGETIRAALLGSFRPDADRPGAALSDWLSEQAQERDITGRGLGLQRLVFEWGRVAGATVGTPSGTRLIRATDGVVLSTAAVPAGAAWPVQPELRDCVAQVAMVSRTGSRFGRVELVSGT
jgi:hypothetical protein